MGLQEILWKSVDWIDLAQDNLTWWALVNTVTKLWVLSIAGNFLTSWGAKLVKKASARRSQFLIDTSKSTALWCWKLQERVQCGEPNILQLCLGSIVIDFLSDDVWEPLDVPMFFSSSNRVESFKGTQWNYVLNTTEGGILQRNTSVSTGWTKQEATSRCTSVLVLRCNAIHSRGQLHLFLGKTQNIFGNIWLP